PLRGERLPSKSCRFENQERTTGHRDRWLWLLPRPALASYRSSRAQGMAFASPRHHRGASLGQVDRLRRRPAPSDRLLTDLLLRLWKRLVRAVPQGAMLASVCDGCVPVDWQRNSRSPFWLLSLHSHAGQLRFMELENRPPASLTYCRRPR